MVRYTRKKWPYLIPLLYLMVAVPGSFAFSLAEIDFPGTYFDSDKLHAGTLDSGDYSVISPAFDWMAEDTTTINKASKDSSLPLRNGLVRIFTLWGIHIAAVSFTEQFLEIIKKSGSIAIKNNLPLMLRI